LVIIQIGEYVNRLSDEFKAEHDEMPRVTWLVCELYMHIIMILWLMKL